MNEEHAKAYWDEYRVKELEVVTPLLKKLGYALEEEQAHIAGERFLMVGERDVGGGGFKLVLIGKHADGRRVVIKVSSTPKGKEEIASERRAREAVRTITFSYKHISVPEELLYTQTNGVLIFITEYIEQDCTFLERTTEEQFRFTLDALKSQESFHATTPSHSREIQSVFGVWNTKHYLRCFDSFVSRSIEADKGNVRMASLLKDAHTLLEENKASIEQYTNFLLHADFVPHNFRIRGDTLYLLDSASLHFGNKYESWARFLNFMLLYNRPLEEALVTYVAKNRAPEESHTLRLMRIYKLGKLLEYYTGTLPKTSGDLRALAERRIAFWCDVLESLLHNTRLDDDVIASYTTDRDALRSQEEKKRQESLH